jgi:hypothetical protein
VTPLTAADVLGANEALLGRATQLLDARPKFSLSGEMSRDRAFKLDASGVDRVDVYADGRPLTSVTNPDGAAIAFAPDAPAPGTLLLYGFVAGAAGPVVSFRWDAPARQ